MSAGSSVGARDETAAAVASLGEPGIWCHGLALRPGKPTLLADCGGVPVIGLPGNPRSALVVFRLVGMPIVRAVGGCTDPPPEPTLRARLERDLPSAAGRLDVVQVRLAGAEAVPLFGSSSLLSILTAADGYIVVPESATGVAAGSEVEVTLTGSGGRENVRDGRATPFIHDRPAAEALAAWEEACAAAGCPERLDTVSLPLGEAVGRVTAEPVWARTSSPPFDAAAMDGIAVRAADTVGASETAPVRLDAAAFEIVDTGDPIPGDFDAVVMREDVHTIDDAVELRAAAAPYQHVRSIGEDVSAAELLLPSGHRLRPVDVAAAGAAGVH